MNATAPSKESTKTVDLPEWLVDEMQHTSDVCHGLPPERLLELAACWGLSMLRDIFRDAKEEQAICDQSAGPDSSHTPNLIEYESIVAATTRTFTQRFLDGCPGLTIREVSGLLKALADEEPLRAGEFVADMLKWLKGEEASR
ncbi:hypothetical protein [Pontiella sulfatireligans]|uniref:Uncharacterized protein n=1 Tax=Pontiella sulfatireligans TaxID=2750658 RepID=A0A6C2ULJ8_9BACT|nr:hypothetical protein [Pontiella sulfatireligans]VGO21125.1 hypothetical protein SCARR_03195 [Pontiella sulfatireligans]